MEFDIVKYTNNAEYRLTQISIEGRIAFAAWCAQGLIDESLPFLLKYLQFEDLEAMQEAILMMWRASGGEPIPVDTHERVRVQCMSFFWLQVGFSDQEIVQSFSADQALNSVLLALDVCNSGSPSNAALAAECWINVLDRQLTDELQTNSYTEIIFQHPKMTSEIARQQRMLDYLEENGGLRQNEKRLFRG